MLGKLRICLIGLGLLGLSACSTVDVAKAPAVNANDVIAVLPVSNYTETPDAGRRVASIAFGVLQVQGHQGVVQDMDASTRDPLFGDASSQSLSKDLEWARQARARYALTGSVQEWRYKTGVDGEPAVGVSFTLIDLENGSTVWTATGSRSGWSRSSLSGVGQTLIRSLLQPLRVSGR